MKRDRLFTIRVSDDELDRLAQLAEHTGQTQSDWFRQVLRIEYTRVFGAYRPPRKGSR